VNDAAIKHEISFQDALNMRQETFIARYPRKIKIIVSSVLLLVLFVPMLFIIPADKPIHKKKELSLERKVSAYNFEDINSKIDQEYKKRLNIVTHRPETEVEKKAANENDTDFGKRMHNAPDQGLIEKTSFGLLPVISKNGRQAWQVYSRPFNHQDPRPRISIVISDLGMSSVATDAVLHKVPKNVTLAFDIHSKSIKEWLERARNEGHETLISLPMEPYDYPRSDPGSNSLLTSIPDSDNIQRLLRFLGKATGYVGVTTFTGSRFSSDREKTSIILDELKKRGLMVFDAKITRNSVVELLAEEKSVPVSSNNSIIDYDPTPEAIDEALMYLEKTARVNGSVVAVASPLPVTLERLSLWSKDLSKRGFVLAPLSAVVH